MFHIKFQLDLDQQVQNMILKFNIKDGHHSHHTDCLASLFKQFRVSIMRSEWGIMISE